MPANGLLFIPWHTCAAGVRREHILCATGPAQPWRNSRACSIPRDTLLSAQVSPTSPLCQVLRGKKNPSSAGEKEGQKKSIQINLPWGHSSKQALPGWFGSIPTCQAAAGSCCAQSAAGVWHQNVLVLGSSQGTLYSRNDLRKDEQPGQQNTCSAGQTLWGARKMLPSGVRACRPGQGNCGASTGDFHLNR